VVSGGRVDAGGDVVGDVDDDDAGVVGRVVAGPEEGGAVEGGAEEGGAVAGGGVEGGGGEVDRNPAPGAPQEVSNAIATTAGMR